MKKRIFSLALALVMTLALAAPVFAEGEEAPAPEYRLAGMTKTDGTDTFSNTFVYDQGGWLPTAQYSYDTVLIAASYDDAGRVVSEDGLDGGVRTYEYDENGNLLVSGTHYDEVYGLDGDTSTTYTYAYDENGNCIGSKFTNAYGSETTARESEYTYDDAGNTLSGSGKSYINGELTSQYQSTYDDAGNLLRTETTSSDGAVSTTEYTYDEAGNLLRSEHFTDGVTDYAYECTYDEAGNRLSETYYSDGEKQSEATYVYDDEGRVVQEDYVSSAHSYSYEYTYTPLQTFEIQRFPDSSYLSFYLCDSVGTEIFSQDLPGLYTDPLDIGEPQFTYDDNGYVTQIDFDNGVSVTFTYEPVV